TPRALRQHAAVPRSRSNRLDLRFSGLGHTPLIRALETFPITPASLVGFRLGADVPAFGALLGDRLVPTDEVALRIVLTAVEGLAPLLGTARGDISTVLRAFHARRHRPGAAAFREGATPQEFTRPPAADDHHLAAHGTGIVR